MAPKMRLLLVLVLALYHHVGVVQGYSSGDVFPACSDMTPGHGGENAQTTGSPFELELSETEIEAGGYVILTLKRKSNSDPEFKGFLIQAKDEADDSLVGEFTDVG